ncbi:MAG: hypothetical protein J6K98_02285 [Clostridia bacterium]|nr:hypothetical protein [Clostridia bacterium]
MNICQEDIAVLRELAQTYMEYASLPVQQEKRRLWMCLNGLQMQKPMVAIDQMPWHELDVDGSLVCRVKDPYFREVEWNLRMQIYKWEHLPADMVLNPYILLPRPIQNTGYGIEMVRHTRTTDVNNSVVGQHFINQLEEPEDIEKIKIPQVSIDRAYEAELRATAERIFEGIAPVRMQGVTMHVGLWDFITQWMGVENCYIELMDRPEFMHAIMERLTTATIAMIEQINEQKLYGVNDSMCHCSYTFDETLPGKNCDRENPITSDGWAFGLAQLFTAVSPAITAEFEVPYMQRIFPYFGSIYYGCCDRLDDRLDVVARMPNIRKISCSPWSDREHFAEVLPKQYIMSNKPNPALLAEESFDEEAVRADLRRTIRAAQENHIGLEMILKDISTVRYEPQRLWRWSEIATEETLRAACG